MTKTELAEATGYTSVTKAGKVRSNFTAMTDALVEATGIKIGGGASDQRGKGGRKLSFTAKVQGNGNLLVGKAYTSLLDLVANDEFTIKLNKNSGTIRLIPVGGGEETEEG